MTIIAVISLEGAGGLVITGANGSVLDQAGPQIMVKDGIPATIGACVGLCISLTGNLDETDPDGFSSISYFIGGGKGVDLNVELLGISDWFFYDTYINPLNPQWQ